MFFCALQYPGYYSPDLPQAYILDTFSCLQISCLLLCYQANFVKHLAYHCYSFCSAIKKAQAVFMDDLMDEGGADSGESCPSD